MSFWEPQTFREVTAGRWLCRPQEQGGVVDLKGVSTDTRTLRPGQVFFALVGPRHDGHDYLQAAVDGGSPLLIVQREQAVEGLDLRGAGVLLVDDTQGALGRLAAHWRRSFTARVIAVTGTVGKTTTRQMIHAVLGQVYRGKASPHSYNNQIGVPLTLLSVEGADRYVVVEAGTSAPGEISRLARWIEPDIAIITHVGLAHTERLGDLETVAREKASLLSHLQDNGLAIVNGDCKVLDKHLKPVRSLVRYGRSAECDLRLTDCRTDAEGLEFEVNGRWRYRLPTWAKHHAVNALAAVAVGRHMNLDDTQIAEGLARTDFAPMRGQVERLGRGRETVTVINDAYNANPDSMAAALQMLADCPVAGPRGLVLGDMLELGRHSKAEHRRLGQAVGRAGVQWVLFVGPASAEAAEAARQALGGEAVGHVPSWGEQARRWLLERVEAGQVVLVKASRGVGLERAVQAIAERFGRSDQQDRSGR